MFTKLIKNQRGFGLHLALPLIAILVVGAIGAYMQFRSNAYVPPEGWTTIKSVSGSWGDKSWIEQFPISTSYGKKYRICVTMKASSSQYTTYKAYMETSGYEILGNTSNPWPEIYTNLTTSYKTYCSTSVVAYHPDSPRYVKMKLYRGPNNLTRQINISNVKLQRYY